MSESKERQAFLAFATARGLGIDAGTIQEPPPPAPDILVCSSGECTAYEMTEAVEPDYAQKLSAILRTPALVRDAYAGTQGQIREAIEQRHYGKMIGVCFRDEVTLKRRRALMQQVFKLIGGIDSSLGASGTERIEDLLPELHHVSMRQIGWNGIHWEADPTAGWIDPEGALRTRLVDKMANKSYETEFPIELIAYFWREVTPPPNTGWIDAMRAVASDFLGASPFQRVWIYDDWTKVADLLAERK
jgi:hypothetical protein